MFYTRLYTDAEGESRFEDIAMNFQIIAYAPPAPSLQVSGFAPATQYGCCWRSRLACPRRFFRASIAALASHMYGASHAANLP